MTGVEAEAAQRGEASIPIERIRLRAYHLWERHDCPPGLALRFWLLAERQVRSEIAAERGVAGRQARDRPVYRALFLDAQSNVLGTEVLLAHTDAEALALAQAMAWDVAVELWDGLRFIEQIAPACAPDATPEP